MKVGLLANVDIYNKNQILILYMILFGVHTLNSWILVEPIPNGFNKQVIVNFTYGLLSH